MLWHRRGVAWKYLEENLRLGSARYLFPPLVDHWMGLDANRMYEEKEIEADGIRTCICQQVFRGQYFLRGFYQGLQPFLNPLLILCY